MEEIKKPSCPGSRTGAHRFRVPPGSMTMCEDCTMTHGEFEEKLEKWRKSMRKNKK